MRIQPINPPQQDRYQPEAHDRAWLVMVNQGSGADGASQARAGDVTCLRVVGNSTYTDPGGVARNVGYEAIEAHATNAPIHLLLGAWHDTPKVGKAGRVQCSGWDDDVLVLADATYGGPGSGTAPAVAGEPHLDEPATPAYFGTAQAEGFLVEPTANVTGGAANNMAVYWRIL